MAAINWSSVSGLDCCKENPDNYKVVAEIPSCGRLVEMTLQAGKQDKAHDHPIHYMYVVQGGKLRITTPDGAKELEVPAGAPMIAPPGPHQVANVGDGDVKIVFVEPAAVCQPCAPLDGFISPLDVAADCYTKLDGDDDWFIGRMAVKAGASDPPHSHMDHLCYVLAGDKITIYPGLERGAEKMEVPLSVGQALPVPAGHHSIENNGKQDAEIIFFERKK